MGIISIIIIALTLTFDTFAISITAGLVENKIKLWQAAKIALIFAFLQALFPVIGWLLGVQISHLINAYQHWFAFALLVLIGSKMIFEALKNEEQKKTLNIFELKVILVLGIATSIDALIIGFSFAFLDVNIWLAAFIIGFFTYFVAMIGMLVGKKTGHLFGRKAEIIGGLVLVGIGIKILIENIK
ncbi:MAG: manganese efflux pump [Bacteroidales bacterium]|nr:manganese efflux pump [Bacteroidales bacterium]